MASNTRGIDATDDGTAPTDRGDGTGGTGRTGGIEPTEGSTGLDGNVAGALSYLFGLVTGLLFYLVEDGDPFVRFHAAQSMAVSGLFFLAYVALSVVGTAITAVMFTSTSTFAIGSVVSAVLGLVWLVVALGGFVLWVYLMIRAYQGETPRIPVAAGIADRLV